MSSMAFKRKTADQVTLWLGERRQRHGAATDAVFETVRDRLNDVAPAVRRQGPA
jgi:hypothetical protein